MSVYLLFVLCCLQLISQGHSECVSPLSDTLVTTGTHIPTGGIVMLFPDLQFNNCTNITTGYVSSIKLVAFLEEAGFVSRFFQVQIWRPTSANNYSLVSSDIINDSDLNETYSNTIKSYFKTYNTNNQKLHFAKNDIIGMYVPPLRGQGTQTAPIVPTFLTNDTGGDYDMKTTSRIYWASIPYSPCNVSLCSSSFNVLNNVILQTKIEVVSGSYQPPTITGCRDERRLLECPTSTISLMSVTASVSDQSTNIISSSSFPVNSVSPTNTLLGLPFPVLIAVPVGGTVLLITLVIILVMSLVCLKHRKMLCKKRTDEVHLVHYTTADGSEYTHVSLSRKSSRASTLREGHPPHYDEKEMNGSSVNMIDVGEEFDVATPLPTPSFVVGSPIATIAPYASLVSIQQCNNNNDDIDHPVPRGRSATINGPINKNFHHFVSGNRSAPHFSVDNLDIISESRHSTGDQQEPMPYIEAVGSMSNIQPPPLPHRPEDNRKLSLPSRYTRSSSATTRNKPQKKFLSKHIRASSAKTRRSSHEPEIHKHVSQLRLQDRKMSHPVHFPHHQSQQVATVPYEKPVSTQQSKRGSFNKTNLERSISLDTKGGAFPNTGHIPSHIDASLRPLPSLPSVTGTTEVSPYMEPSPTTTKKQQIGHHKHFLEKSFSHDVIAAPYTYPSQMKPRKFSEQVSPYLEPSPTPPKKSPRTPQTQLSETKTAFFSQHNKSPLEQRNSTSLITDDSKTAHDIKDQSTAPNFIYILPEEMSRSGDREPHTGQIKSPPNNNNTGQSSPDERLCVPNSAARSQLLSCSPQVEVYAKLERSNGIKQDQPFWSPPSSATELYDTLSHYQYREINRNQISISKCLGEGHYGTVHEGVWQFKGGQLPVAVKTLKPNSPEEDEVKFIQEAAITGQFNHPNIIQLQGVVTLGTPLMIILELLPKGDLKAYLKQQRKSVKNETANIDGLMRSFISFARDISNGMEFLAKKGFVHRDLAARNIFLTNNLTCKIGDFGMARDLAEEDFYESSGTKIPLKWTAPEAVDYRKYSSASDVWSYGMVLYEIWSLGHKPFQNYSNPQILELIRKGYCNPPPPGCPRAVYQLMVLCWNPFNGGRPSFTDITNYLLQPDDVFLQWEDITERLDLGKSLESGEQLHNDLQNNYSTGDQTLSTIL